MHVDAKPLNFKNREVIYIEKMPHLGKRANRAIAKAEGRDD